MDKKKLHLPFDEIVCLNLVEREDRYNKMCEIFKYLGIDDKVKFHRAVKHPHCEEISESIMVKKLGTIYGDAFSCTREHYAIIKSAYLRGLNSIMVIEDDCWFYRDIDELQQYFDNLPDDWDVLRVNCLRGRHEEKHFLKDENINKLWDREFISTYGTGCYCLNRIGMKKMIDWIDKQYNSIDIYLFKYNDLGCNTYIPNRPLALCFPDENGSDINIGIQKTGPQYYYLDIKNIDLSMYKY